MLKLEIEEAAEQLERIADDFAAGTIDGVLVCSAGIPLVLMSAPGDGTDYATVGIEG